MIGILLTKTSFARQPGDIGHPDTLPFPTIIETTARPEDSLPLARNLKSKGAKALITEHDTDPEPFRELSIPIYTSPLTLFSTLNSVPGTIAILSDREAAITPKLLQSFNISPTDPIIIAGMDDMPAFTEGYILGTRSLDPEAVAFEMKFVTQRMLKTTPDLGGIIFASPYMSSYRQAVRQVTEVPILDIVTLANFVHESYS